MELTWDGLRALLFVICGVASAILAPVATVLAVLLVLMALDLVSGLVANGKRRKLDPAVGWGGWKRKANTVVIVVALSVLQVIGEREGIGSLPAAQVVAGGFAVLEFLSIVRNGLLSGVKLPAFVAAMFARLEETITGPPDAPVPRRG